MIFFFFNDTATTEIYTLSLHDALPISRTPSSSRGRVACRSVRSAPPRCRCRPPRPVRLALLSSGRGTRRERRSEEHTSELQSRQYLVCRLLLEKKKNT